jgi:PAS domain S-box-containing protein
LRIEGEKVHSVPGIPHFVGDEFGTLLDAAPVLVAAADCFGRITLFNTACERLTGFRRDDVLGLPFVETLVPPDWHDIVRSRFAGDSPAALAAPHVNPWRTHSGDVRQIEWHCFRADNLPNGPWIIGFGHDITTLAQARHQIGQQASLIDALFEHIPEGITIAEAPDVTIRRVSRFGELLTGRSRDRLEDIPVDDHPAAWGLFHADGVTAATAAELPLTRATQHGEVVTDEEWVMKRPDGTALMLLCNAAPIRDASGRITGGLIAWRDITQRKQLESELRAAARAKDEFLAAVSHELRQPLSACLGALAMMKIRQNGESGERARAVLERQLTQMTRLIDDLLDTSNVTRGVVALDKQRLDLRDAVRSACDAIQTALDARQHSCAVVVSDDPVMVEGDPLRVHQILSNLLANAAKYTPPGGDIQITVGADDHHARVSVRDNGVGIPKDAQARIFDLFTRAMTDGGGFGIGLAVVRRLVEAHGGSIAVVSEGVGHGTEFIVTLPRTH